jgi:hypothetical protein
LHLACMQMLSVVAPPALAATAQGIYGGVAVGTMTAIMTLVSGPLYGAFGPGVLVHGAALRGCVADRIHDAQDLDSFKRVRSDLAGASVVARRPGVFSVVDKLTASKIDNALVNKSGLLPRSRLISRRRVRPCQP